MDMKQIHNYAKKLIYTHGAAAEAHAAARLQKAERIGDRQQIEDWRRIRATVRERKSAHVS